MLLRFATIVCCSICQKKKRLNISFYPNYILYGYHLSFSFINFMRSQLKIESFLGEERDKVNMSEENSVRVLHFNVIDTYRVGETIQDDLHSFIHFSLLGYSK